MSEAKWTAGPWSIVRYGDGSSLVIHSDTDNRVCFMATASSDRPTSHAEIRANARLISAAPDLAEALEAIMQAADSVKLRLCDDPDEYSDHEKHRALNNLYDEIGGARAALSKAGGLAGASHD